MKERVDGGKRWGCKRGREGEEEAGDRWDNRRRTWRDCTSLALGNLPPAEIIPLAPGQDLAEFWGLKSAATTIKNFHGDNYPGKVKVEKPTGYWDCCYCSIRRLLQYHEPTPMNPVRARACSTRHRPVACSCAAGSEAIEQTMAAPWLDPCWAEHQNDKYCP